MVILGLDPGLRCTGWGIIRWQHSRLSHVAHGTIITSPKEPTPSRLVALFSKLTYVCTTYSPDEAALEEIFVNKNPTASLKLSLGRGVVMLAPALKEIPLIEYPSTTIKKTVVGHGHAHKTQISHMVHFFLPTAKDLTADAADALAIAICHAHHTKTLSSLSQSPR